MSTNALSALIEAQEDIQTLIHVNNTIRDQLAEAVNNRNNIKRLFHSAKEELEEARDTQDVDELMRINESMSEKMKQWVSLEASRIRIHNESIALISKDDDTVFRIKNSSRKRRRLTLP